MPGKAHATHYSEMRNVVIGLNKNRNRLKPEVVPGLFTFILMLSKRYARVAEACAHKHITHGIPGMAETAERMGWACENLNMLAQLLPQPFSRDDWDDAAKDTCAALGINPGDLPVMEIDCDALAQTLPGLPNGPDTDPTGSSVEPCLLDDEGTQDANGEPLAPGSHRDRRPDLERDGETGRDGANASAEHRASGPKKSRQRGSDSSKPGKPKRGRGEPVRG